MELVPVCFREAALAAEFCEEFFIACSNEEQPQHCKGELVLKGLMAAILFQAMCEGWWLATFGLVHIIFHSHMVYFYFKELFFKV